MTTKPTWESFEQIKIAFKLPRESDDLREARRILRSRLKKIHPDATNGEFSSEFHEAEFHRIQGAIEFLDKALTPGLPTVTRDALLVATEFSDAIVTTLREGRDKDRELERGKQLQDRQKRANDQLDAEIRKRYRFYKIAAGVVAAFFGFLSLFPEKFTTHPVFLAFSQFTNALDITISLAMLYIMIAAALAVLYLFWEEQRLINQKKQYLSDAGIERIVKSKAFSTRLGPMGGFTRADLVSVLEEHKISRDHNVLHDVADLIIEKLLIRKAAKKIEKPSINDIFELDFGVYIDIRPEKK
ncbi:MAG: hypothetical protein ACREEE_14170 [Dongiaceae bacterium]